MGNGEQYIWKPPEEDEVIVPGVPQLENGHSHPTAVEVTSPLAIPALQTGSGHLSLS